MTEGELAARLARDLGPLAIDVGWSTAATDDQPQGHYSDAIADAKDDMAVDVDLADAVLSRSQLAELHDRALLACLERLERYYTTLVDTSTGSGDTAATQKLSQVQIALARVRANLDKKIALRAPAAGAVVRGRRRPDYSLGAGDEVEE